MTEAETPKLETAEPEAVPASRHAHGWLLGALGWAVPGMGHLLLKKYDRAAVFFVSVSAMAWLGLAMGGKLYAPPFDRSQGFFVLLLHLLGFVGDLGAGVFFFGARMMGWGQVYMDRALGDYGTVFFLCAGLLNLLTALDAYDIAVGKKN
jgi:hypothetical protein